MTKYDKIQKAINILKNTKVPQVKGSYQQIVHDYETNESQMGFCALGVLIENLPRDEKYNCTSTTKLNEVFGIEPLLWDLIADLNDNDELSFSEIADNLQHIIDTGYVKNE